MIVTKENAEMIANKISKYTKYHNILFKRTTTDLDGTIQYKDNIYNIWCSSKFYKLGCRYCSIELSLGMPYIRFMEGQFIVPSKHHFLEHPDQHKDIYKNHEKKPMPCVHMETSADSAIVLYEGCKINFYPFCFVIDQIESFGYDFYTHELECEHNHIIFWYNPFKRIDYDKALQERVQERKERDEWEAEQMERDFFAHDLPHLGYEPEDDD